MHYTLFTLSWPPSTLNNFFILKDMQMGLHQCIRHAKAGIVLETQPDCNWRRWRTRNPNTLQWHSSVINTFESPTIVMEELAYQAINTFYLRPAQCEQTTIVYILYMHVITVK